MPSDILRLAFAQLWQVTLLILLVTVVVRLTARNRPQLAHTLWLLVVIKCVTPPLWSSQIGVFSWMQALGESSRAAPATTAAILSNPSQGDAREVPNSPESPSPDVATSQTAGRTAPETKPPNELPPLESRPAPRAAYPSHTASASRWREAVLGLWLAGAGWVAFAAFRQWRTLQRIIRRDAVPAGPEFQRMAERLARRLRLRGRPRVLIVKEFDRGPAVLGLLRSKILLPEAVVENMSLEQVQLILAHEIVHARRGDAWFGLLQVAAQAAWWFHPLVWRAGRQLLLEADRCCDEAVVAELACEPPVYAGCLVDVMACRNGVGKASFPPAPGAGNARGAARRLERIMRLRSGLCKRTPWWCWLVLIALAAVALPGAAMMASPEPGSDPVSEDVQYWAPPAYSGSPVLVSAKIDSRPRKTEEFDVDDLLARMMQQDADIAPNLRKQLTDPTPLSREEAEAALLRQLAALWPAYGEMSGVLNAWWSDGELCVNESEEGLAAFRTMIEALGRDELVQISAKTTFLEFSPGVLKRALPGRHWCAPPLSEAARQRLIASGGTTGEIRTAPDVAGSARIERRIARRIMRLSEDEARRLIAAGQEDHRSNLIQAPGMTVFEGARGTIADLSQTPFVVDATPVVGDYATAYQPIIEVVDEGTTVSLCGKMLDDEAVRLSVEVTRRRILDVETINILGETHEETAVVHADEPVDMHRDGISIQCPQVETARISCTVDVPTGNSLLVALPSLGFDESRERMMLVRPKLIRPKLEARQ